MEEPLVTDEQAKAIQEIAKTANTGMETVQSLARAACRFIADPAEQLSGWVGDKFRYMRVDQALRYAELLSRKLEQTDQSVLTKRIPLNVISPIFDQMVLEDEEDVQELWANLLLNGIDSTCDTEVTKSIVGILRELGSLEARCLNTIVQAEYSGNPFTGVPIYGLPDRVVDRTFHEAPVVPENIQIALQNLKRLGCIEVRHIDELPSVFTAGVTPTVIGKAILRVCTRP